MDDIYCIIAGSRSFNDYELLTRMMGTVGKVDVVVSGKARGADTLGERWAREHGVPIIEFPAQWDLYSKAAGYMRNLQMARFVSEHNGMLVAFWDGKSKGTSNMIFVARQYKLNVKVVNYLFNKELTC